MDSPTLEPGHAQRKVCEFPLLARNGHGPMSDLSPLSGVKQKSNFGAVKSAFDPGCSLIPGLRSRLSKNILAGFRVLSAVGACPPHDGVG
jgi:hypothetical protein